MTCVVLLNIAKQRVTCGQRSVGIIYQTILVIRIDKSSPVSPVEIKVTGQFLSICNILHPHSDPISSRSSKNEIRWEQIKNEPKKNGDGGYCEGNNMRRTHVVVG